MRVLVIDGQGGGLGKQLVTAVKCGDKYDAEGGRGPGGDGGELRGDGLQER